MGNECDIEILAYLQRKDKTIKPLGVTGFTKVVEAAENVEKMKSNDLKINDSSNVGYMYSIQKQKKNGSSYSGEVNLMEEDIDVQDKIIIQIHNRAKNSTGFSQTFVYDDFGWKNVLRVALVS